MQRISFNENWKFYKEDRASDLIPGRSDPAKEQTVTLPHDAMIGEERDPSHISGWSGGYYPGGTYVYSKTFNVAPEELGQVWLLEFEGAMGKARVYVNDHYVTANHYGYVGFQADLTALLKAGENRVTVRVCNDDQPNSRWYTGSGLYLPVWLWRGGGTRLSSHGVRISTPEVSGEISQVHVAMEIIHRETTITTVRVDTVILDADGQKVAMESTPATLFPGEAPVITQRIFIRKARLWFPGEGHLYTCEITLRQENRRSVRIRNAEEMAPEPMVIYDTAAVRFGIRHIQADPQYGLRINGRQVQLRGACIHHDQGILGAATFDDSEQRRIRILQNAGFNAVRIAHQPASLALLTACDALGMLVLEESFDAWNHGKKSHDYAQDFSQYWKADIEAIVDKDYNHPSVFMYSIGNEISEIGRAEGIHYSRLLGDHFHRLDPTRFVTAGMNGGMLIEENKLELLKDMGLIDGAYLSRLTGKAEPDANDIAIAIMRALYAQDVNEFMTTFMEDLDRVVEHPSVGWQMEEAASHQDICGYNYMMSRYEPDRQEHPNRILFGSETNPPKIDLLWAYTKKDPGVLGDFTWTGYDYLGESGIGLTNYEGQLSFHGNYPCFIAYCGDVDITGYRRPLSYFREIVFGLRTQPYITVQDPKYFERPVRNNAWAVPETVAGWTWPGQEGRRARVRVYTPGDTLLLYCNGEKVGEKTDVARFQAVFEIPYVPGVLEAVAYGHGKEIGRSRLCTAQEDMKLCVRADKTVLKADGSDLAYLEIELTDPMGVIHMEADREVTVSVEGGIHLQGFGSADPNGSYNFTGNVGKTYYGRILACVRGTAQGPAAVSITSEGMAPVSIGFQVSV